MLKTFYGCNGAKGGWFVVGPMSRMIIRVDGLVPWKGNNRKGKKK